MALLFRASFLGLCRSRLAPFPYLSSQRELLQPPESSSVLRRWYGESAALDETCSSTQNETAGATIQGEDSSKVVDAQGSLKESVAGSAANQECTSTKESSSKSNTDKLASEIIGKLRLRNLNGSKNNGAIPPQTESMFSKADKSPEVSIRDDKFKQVVNSMRKLAAKRNANLASGGAMSNLAKTEERENQDDFADLDLPQGRGDTVLSKGSNNSESFSRSAADAFRNFMSNAKLKEGGLQGSNAKQKEIGFQQKAKETKPVSFSFLKSLDTTATNSAGAEDDSFFSSNASTSKDSVSNLTSRLQNLQPPSSNSLKSDTKATSSRESKSASMEKFTPSNVNETITRDKYPGYTVCIRNLPSHSNLAVVKENLSLHGEVVSSFKKSNSDGSCNAFIEFKTADAMDGALASRWVYLDSKAFRIVRADAPNTTVVRLSKVSADTTESQLVTICEKFGGLDYIRKRATGVYDVYYRANELSNMSTILDSLNEVTLNQSRLVAISAPLLHPLMRKEMLKGSEGQIWHASQLSQMLNRIESGLDLVSVCFEDLKTLTAMEDEMTK